jgi:hypothetical protein
MYRPDPQQRPLSQVDKQHTCQEVSQQLFEGSGSFSLKPLNEAE